MADQTQIDLLEAVKDSLNNQGLLCKFKAELRSNVIAMLKKNNNTTMPTIPDDTKFINELIREYLSFNGFIYTEKILCDESGTNCDRMSRDMLTTKLKVVDDAKSSKIPLLYYIVNEFQNE